MIKKFLKISAFLMLLGFWSCKDYLDVNHDPNVLGDIPNTQVLLPTAEVNLANTLMGWELGFSGGFWSQYWTQAYGASQFKFLCDYSPAKHGRAYNNLTSGVLNDLKKIGKKAKENKQTDLAFIAEALEIYTWQMVTDIWGDVPYFEAMKGNEGVKEPKYDKGQVIYADLNKRINKLLTKTTFPEDLTFEAKYDFIYDGNMEDWVRFAKSLKLKLMLRVSETSAYNNSKVLAYVNANKADFIQNSALISSDVWSDGEEGKRHPMREAQAGGANYVRQNVVACKTFHDYLAVNGDPRLKTGTFENFGDKSAFFGDYASLDDTDQDGTIDKEEDYARPGFAPNEKEPENVARMQKFLNIVIMSTWEVSFYIAEVYQRAGDNANAKLYYEQGITQSLTMHEVDLSTVDFTTSYFTWDPNKGLEQIAMQKWVSYANFQHYEAFLERNRLKIPKVWNKDIKVNRQDAYDKYADHIGQFTISVEGRGTLGGALPASACYPDFILARNSNSPNQKINLGTKIWWDKKPENIVK